MDIGDRSIGDGEPTYVIAEAGSNHNGDLNTAKRLVEVAADAGADAVKFQTFRADRMYVEDSGQAEYLDDNRTIYQIIEDMEMPYEWIPTLAEYCHDQGVQFLSTPFDPQSAQELAEYVPAFKVASYTMSHHPFLEELARMGKPVIMSTGAHERDEVAESVDCLTDASCNDLALLHCVAAYPTPLASINVRVVETLAERFSVPVGLSDHTLDPRIAPGSAVALGADIVEKHFTLDRSMEGPDHQFALEPDELETMITHIRRTEDALGEGDKTVLDVESELHDIARRHIHATTEIEPGETLTEDNIAVLRSGKRSTGLAPKFYDDVLDATATRRIDRDEGLDWDDIER